MKIPDKLYNILKWISIVAIPAATTLFGVIATQFPIPYAQEILTICPAVATFIGALIGLSSAKYYQDQKQNTYSVSEVMQAVEKWMSENQIKGTDVPED